MNLEQGFRSDADCRTAKTLFASMSVLEMLGATNAIKAAENFRALRKKGITIRKTADVIIATACIEANVPLLFQDKDFLPFVDHMGLRAALRRT